MRKMIVIAVREYLAAVRTKSFIVSLLIIPMLMGGGVLLQLILKRLEDPHDKRFAIVDRSPGQQYYSVIEAAARQRKQARLQEADAALQATADFALERVEPSEN